LPPTPIMLFLSSRSSSSTIRILSSAE
jgi:hypothetical protein